jgi:integrase
MGLGSTLFVSLAQARRLAAEARSLVTQGRDPIAERKAARNGTAAETPPGKTFGEVADEVIADNEPRWRNAKHAAQWKMTLKEYAAPLRAKPVADVTTDDVLGVLKPIWHTKPETASRLRGRIENVLDVAAATKLRAGDNPARWKGHLSVILKTPKKLSRGHHRALPFDEVPAFLARLRVVSGLSALALEFTILTAARSAEVLGARWPEIDFAKRLWTVHAARMKGGREHRVPLSDAALAILTAAATIRQTDSPDEYVFPGAKPGRPLSSMALDMVCRRLAVNGTPHGFRSSFRDWCGECTDFPREVAEAALAHAVGDKVEQAYRRGDALEKRRKLMDAWGAFCAGQALATRETAESA